MKLSIIDNVILALSSLKMQVIFTDKFLEKVYLNEDYNPKGYHPEILEAMVDAVDALFFASDLESLKKSHAFACKKLDGKYQKYNIYRIKLTRGRRLFFRLEKDGTIQIINILEINNHDYNFNF